MSDVKTTISLPKEISARLDAIGDVGRLRILQLPVVDTPVLLDHVVSIAKHIVPERSLNAAEIVAVLNPRHPVIEGVARIDLESVTFYSTDTTPSALIGTFFSDPEFPAFLRLTFEQPLTGLGMLVTCRAWGGSVGPHYPGYFHVNGPGIAASFEDNGYPTTFTFFVPAQPEAGTEVKIFTDVDRIRLWGFYDLTLTQV